MKKEFIGLLAIISLSNAFGEGMLPAEGSCTNDADQVKQWQGSISKVDCKCTVYSTLFDPTKPPSPNYTIEIKGKKVLTCHNTEEECENYTTSWLKDNDLELKRICQGICQDYVKQESQDGLTIGYEDGDALFKYNPRNVSCAKVKECSPWPTLPAPICSIDELVKACKNSGGTPVLPPDRRLESNFVFGCLKDSTLTRVSETDLKKDPKYICEAFGIKK